MCTIEIKLRGSEGWPAGRGQQTGALLGTPDVNIDQEIQTLDLN